MADLRAALAMTRCRRTNTARLLCVTALPLFVVSCDIGCCAGAALGGSRAASKTEYESAKRDLYERSSVKWHYIMQPPCSFCEAMDVIER